MRCARIRQFHPSVRIEPTSEDALGKVPRRRGRPKGSRTAPRLVPVRHRQFLGVDCTAYPEVHPALWNLLVSLTTTLFKGMLGVLRQLKVEQRGDEQCRLLFEELPEVMVATVREIASWWWTHDRGFQGTTVRCPQCHNHDLKYIGERKKESVCGWVSTGRAFSRPARRWWHGSRAWILMVNPSQSSTSWLRSSRVVKRPGASRKESAKLPRHATRRLSSRPSRTPGRLCCPAPRWHRRRSAPS